MTSHIRLFVSFPSDVTPERNRVAQVVARLEAEFAEVEFEVFRWEDSYYTADKTFQAQILSPADCDLVVLIVWKRLGTPLPEPFNRADGTSRTGTEYEFEEAMAASLKHGSPDILIYRKTEAVLFNAETVDQEQAQFQALAGFWQRWICNEKGHFTGAFKPFEDTDSFDALLSEDLRVWLHDKAEEVRWPAAKGSPFRGLEVFDEQHAAVFFGRQHAVRELRAKLLANANQSPADNFMLVVGASGSGKSSLVRAGLIPALHKQGFVFAHLLTTPSLLSQAQEDDPSCTPLMQLAKALFNHLPTLADGDCESAEDLAELFNLAPGLATNPLEGAIKRANTTTHQYFLILLDQLEEIFQWPSEPRELFLKVIQALVKSEFLLVVATLRSDFYPQLIESEALKALSGDNRQYNLAPVREYELKAVIEGPAKAAGLEFEAGQDGRLLNELLLDDARGEANVLPLLEFTLERLYQQRDKKSLLTFAAYQQLGGLTRAIGEHAEATLMAMQHGEGLFLQVIKKLVSVNEAGEATRGQTRLDKFDNHERLLIDALVKARLLVTENEQNPGVGLVHDALLTHWPRTQIWLADNQDFNRWYARVKREAKQWKTENKSKERLLPKGKPLLEAESFLKGRKEDIKPLVGEFIRASVKQRRRQLMVSWGLAAGVFISLFGLTLYSLTQKQQADILLGEAKKTLIFMNYDLRDVLDKYAPTTERLAILQSVDRLVATLQDYGGDDADSRRERATVLINKADVILQNADSDPSLALPMLLEAYELGKTLTEQHPENATYQRDLSVSHNKLGDIYLRLGQTQSALTAYQASLVMREKLAEQDPGNTGFQRDLSVSHDKLGDIYLRLGQTQSALTAYQASLVIAEKLAEQDPGNTGFQRDLSVSHNKLGDIYLRLGQTQSALTAYQASLVMREKLAEQDPKNVEFQRDIAVSYYRVGNVLIELKETAMALVYFEKARDQLTRMDENNTLAADDTQWIQRFSEIIADLKKQLGGESP